MPAEVGCVGLTAQERSSAVNRHNAITSEKKTPDERRRRRIGSFFSGLGRTILPWLKTGGKALLREGLGTGLQVAQDALAGRNVGESFKEHARDAGQRLLQGAAQHIIQSGSGVRKRKRAAPPGQPSKRINPTVRKPSSHKTQHHQAGHSDIFS